MMLASTAVTLRAGTSQAAGVAVTSVAAECLEDREIPLSAWGGFSQLS
jgi:hypothetical protein